MSILTVFLSAILFNVCQIFALKFPKMFVNSYAKMVYFSEKRKEKHQSLNNFTKLSGNDIAYFAQISSLDYLLFPFHHHHID